MLSCAVGVEKAHSALSLQLAVFSTPTTRRYPTCLYELRPGVAPGCLLLRSHQRKLSPGTQKRQVADRAV